jgi:hypothetical protein
MATAKMGDTNVADTALRIPAMWQRRRAAKEGAAPPAKTVRLPVIHSLPGEARPGSPFQERTAAIEDCIGRQHTIQWLSYRRSDPDRPALVEGASEPQSH